MMPSDPAMDLFTTCACWWSIPLNHPEINCSRNPAKLFGMQSVDLDQEYLPWFVSWAGMKIHGLPWQHTQVLRVNFAQPMKIKGGQQGWSHQPGLFTRWACSWTNTTNTKAPFSVTPYHYSIKVCPAMGYIIQLVLVCIIHCSQGDAWRWIYALSHARSASWSVTYAFDQRICLDSPLSSCSKCRKPHNRICQGHIFIKGTW